MAGVAALLWSFEPDLTNEDVAEAIKRTARDYGPAGPDHQWGTGLVRADDAMKLVGCCNTFGKFFTGGVDSVTLAEPLRQQEFRNVKHINTTPDTWRTTYARLYRLEKSIAFGGGATLVDWWARERSCSTWPDTLRYDAQWQATWADVDRVAGGTGEIFGYVYEVFADAAMQDTLGWYPFHPDSALVVWNYSTVTNACGSSRAGTTPPLAPLSVGVKSVSEEGAVLQFRLPRGGEASFEVFDVAGRMVSRWQTRSLGAETHETRWTRGPAAAGVYFVRMTFGGASARTKLNIR